MSTDSPREPSWMRGEFDREMHLRMRAVASRIGSERHTPEGQETLDVIEWALGRLPLSEIAPTQSGHESTQNGHGDKSETPRTDAFIDKWKDQPGPMREMSAMALVRKLERELNAARSATGLSALERFGLAVLDEHRNDGYPGDIDGGWAQDEALRLGLLKEREVKEPCDPVACACAEVTDFPTTCYFESDEVQRARRAVAATDSGSDK